MKFVVALDFEPVDFVAVKKPKDSFVMEVDELEELVLIKIRDRQRLMKLQKVEIDEESKLELQQLNWNEGFQLHSRLKALKMNW